MIHDKLLIASNQSLFDKDHLSHLRSGTEARMPHMPAVKLCVWGRRYGLTQPALSPGGQRFYSADDVRRLALLKQLTDLGHAIGSLAALNMSQLQRVAATHIDALVATKRSERTDAAQVPIRAWRLAVIGATLGNRLQRSALLRRLGPPVMVLGPLDNAAQGGAALQDSAVDAALIHEPQLHDDWLASIHAAAPAFEAVPKALFLGFAAESVYDALAADNITLLRGPQPNTVLAQSLHSPSRAAATAQPAGSAASFVTEFAPPRRWDDAALIDRAGLSSTIARECPRHVVDLLIQLRTSRPAAPSASIEVRPTPRCAVACGWRLVLPAHDSRQPLSTWPRTKASSCLHRACAKTRPSSRARGIRKPLLRWGHVTSPELAFHRQRVALKVSLVPVPLIPPDLSDPFGPFTWSSPCAASF